MPKKNDVQLPYFEDELLRSAFDFASIGMVLVAPDGKWLAVNQAICRISGFSREELLEFTIPTITHPADTPRDLDQMRALLAGEIKRYEIVKRFIRKDGQICWALKSASTVREPDGRPRLVVVQIQDISEKVRLERELAQSQREIENILENTKTAILQYNRECRILYANSMAAKILGRPLNQIVGRTVGDLADIIVNPARLFDAILRVFETKEPLHLESSRLIDGRNCHLLGHLTPQFDPHGEVETVIAMAFNVTEQKSGELELARALDEIKQLQEILPICSYCKKIRDDKDYWQTVENYISAQTGAEFSHSVCPDCLEKDAKEKK